MRLVKELSRVQLQFNLDALTTRSYDDVPIIWTVHQWAEDKCLVSHSWPFRTKTVRGQGTKTARFGNEAVVVKWAEVLSLIKDISSRYLIDKHVYQNYRHDARNHKANACIQEEFLLASRLHKSLLHPWMYNKLLNQYYTDTAARDTRIAIDDQST